MRETTVPTTVGVVEGYKHGNICVWKGIPYAKPPVGALRFQAPEPVEPWDGVRTAREIGPAAMQPEDRLFVGITGRAGLKQSEDCLYLNIWSPGADDARRPVMVWIHGGAYVTGAGSIAWYDGTAFSKHGDVVVVTINYRLGALGFLHLEDLFGEHYAGSGNLGLLDQMAALRFVRENIAVFGGDPNRITVFGESAGAGSVSTLLTLPKAKGLFQQAIMQSGNASLGVHTREEATETAQQLLTLAGVKPGDVEALHAIPAQDLVAARAQLAFGLRFGPVIDGSVVPQHPLDAFKAGAMVDIPVMMGVNRDEYRLFTLADTAWFTDDEAGLRQRVRNVLGPVPDSVIDFYLNHISGDRPYDKVMPLMTYAVFVQSMLQMAECFAAKGTPTFMYRFDYPTPIFGGKLGACHAVEIPFVFDNLHQLGVNRFTGDAPEREPIAKAMHQAWITFAKTGNPNHSALPAWPQYTQDERPVLAFGTEMHVENHPYGAETRAWLGLA